MKKKSIGYCCMVIVLSSAMILSDSYIAASDDVVVKDEGQKEEPQDIVQKTEPHDDIKQEDTSIPASKDDADTNDALAGGAVDSVSLEAVSDEVDGVTSDKETDDKKEIEAEDKKDAQKEKTENTKRTNKAKTALNAWDGSSTDTSWYVEGQNHFVLHNADQLKGLSDLIDNDVTFNGVTISLDNDIYLNPDDDPKAHQSFMIGESKYFYGTFDGQGHTIHNVYIAATSEYTGFFRSTWGLTPVKNLTMSGSISGGKYTAMIAIVNGSATIENVTNKADITGGEYVAGIAAAGVSVFRNCVNMGSIHGTSNYVGGITTYNNAGNVVEDCRNTGNITSNGNYAAGIIGWSRGTLENNFNSGNVSGTGNVGGISGLSADAIRNCTNEGTITNSGYTGGGISGNHTVVASIENCTNRGAVTSWQKAGGIVGHTDAESILKNNTNYGVIQATKQFAGGMAGDGKSGFENCINHGDVSAVESSAGGIIGKVEQDALIKNCENHGAIDVGNDNAGGIAGHGDVDYEGCKNYGNVHSVNGTAGGITGRINPDHHVYDCVNEGDISSDSYFYIGGIAGTDASGVVTKNCKNTGTVSGGGNYMGGILGYGEGSIRGCHNDGLVSNPDGFSIGGIVGESKAVILDCHGDEHGKIEADEQGGGIVGTAEEGSSIKDCTNASQVLVHMNGAGIAGFTEQGDGSIEHCENSGTIKGYKNIAGIVGSYELSGKLKDHRNTGDIIAIVPDNLDDEHGGFGGIAGFVKNSAGIEHNVNDGEVQGIYDYVGGIVAESYDDVTDCVNNGKVTFKETKNHPAHIGGVIGILYNGKNITSCTNTGILHLDLSLAGTHFAGGITSAMNGGVMDDCEFSGTMDITYEKYHQYVYGGLIGELRNATLTKSRNTGNIRAITQNTGNNLSEILGGLAGAVENGTITESYFAGSITSNDKRVDIAGIAETVNNGTIKNCYVRGKLENTNEHTRNIKYRVAGIVGAVFDSSSTISNCYVSADLQANARFVAAGTIFGNAVTIENVYFDADKMGDMHPIYQTNAGTSYEDGVHALSTFEMTGTDALTHMTMRDPSMWKTHADGSVNGAYKDAYYPTLKAINDVTEKVSTYDFGDGYRAYTSISSAAELDAITGAISYHFNARLGNNPDMARNYILTKDIDMEAEDVLPLDPDNNFRAIGNMRDDELIAFTGRFEGGGHRISNLKMSYPNERYIGLFRSIGANGVVQNLIVDGSVEGNHFLGSIAGNNDGTIQNVLSYVDVKTHAPVGYIGGFVGYNNGDINHSGHVGNVTMDDDIIDPGGFYGMQYVGGFIGQNRGEVHQAYHVGDVFASSSEGTVLGGFVGRSDGMIDNIYTAADVSTLSKTRATSYYGALAGSVTSGQFKNSYYNSDAVKANAVKSGQGSVHATAKGATTLEMIGDEAKRHMLFDDFDEHWIILKDDKAGDAYYAYYPQLKVFADVKESTVSYHQVSLPEGTGYVAEADSAYRKDGKVLPGEGFIFTVKEKAPYDADQIIVKDNGVDITDASQTYTLHNINGNHVITVEIRRDTPAVTFPDHVTLTYGEKLKDAQLPDASGTGRFVFLEPEKKLMVRESGQLQRMRFIPDDQIHYHDVEADVGVIVEQGTIKLPDVVHMAYKKGALLKDVILPDGWSWVDDTLFVEEGEKSYLARYHDSEGNYKDMNDIWVVVVMAKHDEDVKDPLPPENGEHENDPDKGENSEKPKAEKDGTVTGDRDFGFAYVSAQLVSLGVIFYALKQKRRSRK